MSNLTKIFRKNEKVPRVARDLCPRNQGFRQGLEVQDFKNKEHPIGCSLCPVIF